MVSVLLFFAISVTQALPVEHLCGDVVDGWSGAPLAHVQLIDLQGGLVARSDDNGHFCGDVIAHMPRLRAVPESTAYEATDLRLPRDARGRLLPSALHVSLLPRHPIGEPGAELFGFPRRGASADADGQDVTDNGANRSPPLWSYSLPAQLPATIRVLRCPGTVCCDAPGDGVETMPFEDYVKGVVNAEVGVFRNISSIDGHSPDSTELQQGSAEVFKTFAVSARGFALYWYLRRAAGTDPGYDIRDGTCEQVYDDERNAWINDAVVATSGEVLALGGGAEIEKFEYASSCNRLGTLPYGISAVDPSCADTVADITGIVTCVGSWCGHDTPDMGHQAHPCDPGGCRCLVRGICQWGACERSYAGQRYTDILAHYQPQLQIVNLGQPHDAGSSVTTGSLVGYIREGDIANSAAGIVGASVDLSTGDGTSSDDQGYYRIDNLLAAQTVGVEVRALGYNQANVDKYLDPSYTQWWRSVALMPVGSDAGTLVDAATQDRGLTDQGAADRRGAEAGVQDSNPGTDSTVAQVRDAGDGKAGDASLGQACDCTSSQKANPLLFCLISLGLFLRIRVGHLTEMISKKGT